MSEVLSLEGCPNCLDERLVKVAQAVGWLVCPGCDAMVRQTAKEVVVVLPPEPGVV